MGLIDRRIAYPFLLAALAAAPAALLRLGVAGEVLSAVAVLGAFSLGRSLVLAADRANQQKLQLDRQLIQSQKLASIGELSSGIAHEINNPLAIIGQEVEWLRHLLAADAEPTGEVQDSLREISRQVSRCREITHKLLDFARKGEPLIQRVEINRLIEDMARLVELEASRCAVRIERHYDPNLPPCWTDAPLIRQVTLNLLNNALYAIGRDGTIDLTTRPSMDGGIDLTVQDSGCGISESDLAKIFDPFFTTKPQGQGTGLGLSICHGIITRLGGRIHVESEEGRGATFTVHLPPPDPQRGECDGKAQGTDR